MSIDPLHRPSVAPHAPYAPVHAPEPRPPVAPAAPEPHPPQRARDQDGFETPTHGPHLSLTPESAELRQTTQGPGGVRQESTATLEAERARFSASRTDAAGGTQRAQAEVTPHGGMRVSGEVNRPGPAGSTTRGSASLTPEGGSASAQVTRGGVTTRAGGSVDANGFNASGGVSLAPSRNTSIQFDAAASRTTRTGHEQGMTTVTTEGQVSMTLGGSAQVRGTGLTGSEALRSQTTFQVRMRDEDYGRVQSGQARQPNPYEPGTLPAGSSVLMRASDSRSSSAGASYQGVSAQQGTTSQSTQSLLVERTGPNTVRLTSGPESSVENTFRLGLSAGPVSASATLTDAQRRSGASHAEFDLSNPQGLAAYHQALATRQLPQTGGPGVSGVDSQERIQLTQGVQGQASAYGFDLSAGLTHEQELTVNRRPDGSQDRGVRLNNNASIPVSLQRTFRPDGSEDESQRRLSLDMTHTDAITAGMLYGAFTGNTDAGNRMNRGPARDVHLTLTQDQVQQLQGRMRSFLAANPGEAQTPHGALIQQLAQARTPQQLVMALGVSADPARLATAMAVVAGEQRLPGGFTVSGSQP